MKVDRDTDHLKPTPILCTCCQHTEHDRDKTGRLWVDLGTLVKPCPRCSQGCQNLRCGQLPANPDGRGYGRLPRRAPQL